uniref:Small ribosomal subunit protein uS15 n=1 Tax=Rhinolophus ferrumequinum TaxID=59479 RepID=A0A671G231_RHIFE
MGEEDAIRRSGEVAPACGLCGRPCVHEERYLEGGGIAVCRYRPWFLVLRPLPFHKQWLKLTSDDVKEQIYKLAKKGLTPSQIGVILRDSHGVAQVRFVTGNKILRILKSKGLAPDLPEDLYHLIKKAVAVRKHLERNRKDKDAKFRLILIESRIHRLARYYKTKRVLPPNWK